MDGLEDALEIEAYCWKGETLHANCMFISGLRRFDDLFYGVSVEAEKQVLHTSAAIVTVKRDAYVLIRWVFSIYQWV